MIDRHADATPFPHVARPTARLQILLLLLGGLIVAQLVTLFLTVLLPPGPPAQRSLGSVARALLGRSTDANRPDRLERMLADRPPLLRGRGWVAAEQPRRDLAALLHAPIENVRLAFYQPPPFAGTGAPPPLAGALGQAADRNLVPASFTPASTPQVQLAGFILAGYQMPPGNGRPGGGAVEGGGFPGGGIPGAGILGDIAPRGGFPDRSGSSGGRMPRSDRSSVAPLDQQPSTPNSALQSPVPVQRSVTRELGGTSATRPTPPSSTAERPNLIGPSAPQRSDGAPGDPRQGPQPGAAIEPSLHAPSAGAPRPALGAEYWTPFVPRPSPVRATRRPEPLERAPAMRDDRPMPTRPAPGVENGGAPTSSKTLPAAPAEAASARTARHVPEPAIAEQVSASSGSARGLFGLAPAPFVEGDFVAALRLPDGRWATVRPAPEPFPNSWQRRVLLWFALAFAIVAPLGWLFARRIVRPLTAFARAAEQLGRDPAAIVLDLDGPAEIGRAAHAFNLMQSRLKSFVDDRTAMVGAISHDLRTPLTRLRFRMEDVADDAVREGMIEEVAEMEAMITSVLAYIRDASTPGARERVDLRSILSDVVADATLVGGRVELEMSEASPVDVDALCMRRLLGNLIENAIKYGEKARVRLIVDEGNVVTDVYDSGPGIPEGEIERVFEPFYRAANAVSSNTKGSGLGLAVCRSIARAHGGDVRLLQTSDGFKAELRLPLAFDIDAPRAA